ncbi:MAG: hypothetical protein KDK74_16130, partial [Cephaloticoccus sp.]|nr:hypothetical protein [Cephaloticoccus sp.]
MRSTAVARFAGIFPALTYPAMPHIGVLESFAPSLPVEATGGVRLGSGAHDNYWGLSLSPKRV